MSSWFDVFAPAPQSTELSDNAEALRQTRNAFKSFWEIAHSEFPENMPMSFEEFYGYMAQRSQETLIDFGKSVYRLDHGFGQPSNASTQAMQAYARKTQGQVAQFDDGYPKMSDFYDALLGKMSEWPVSRIGAAFGNVVKSTGETTVNIATTVVSGYLGIMVAISAVGALLVILSFKKK